MNPELFKVVKSVTDRGLKIIPQSKQRPLFNWRKNTDNHYDSSNIESIKKSFGNVYDRKNEKEEYVKMAFDSFGVDVERSGLVVIDIDDIPKSTRILGQHANELNQTFTVNSGSGKGRHHYFRSDYPNDFKTVVISKHGFDIKAAGGLITAPGSSHKSGKLYIIKNNCEIKQMSAGLVSTLLTLQKENVKQRETAHVISDEKSIPKGARNETLFTIGLNVCRKLSIDSVPLLVNIMGAYNQRCDPPMGKADITKLSERIYAFHVKTFNIETQTRIKDVEDGATTFSDYTVLKAICEFASDKLFYSTSDKRFYIYTGIKWEVDTHNKTTNYIREILSMYWKRFKDIERTDPEAYETMKIDKLHAKMQSHNYFQSIYKAIKTSPELSVSSEDLNSNKFLFNCNNGTIDLKTGELKKHNPYDLITKSSPVKLDKKHYLGSKFDTFLKDIFLSDQKIIEFVQKFFGYCMSGSTKEQKFCIFWGGGQNGKSTLFNILEHVLNDYMRRTPQETLMAQKGTKQTNDLASLFGARIVVASETEKGQRLDEARIKEITGGDSVTCRHLYGDFFTYNPEYKIVIATNNRPFLSDPSYSLRRRMCLVPFNYKIPDEKKDSGLQEYIIENESEQVLYWLDEGFKKYISDGLEIPQSVEDETDKYFKQEDTLGQFLEEKLIANDKNKVSAAELYRVYKNWTEENHEYLLSNRVFGERLAEKGYEKKRGSTGNFYLGVEINKIEQPASASVYEPEFKLIEKKEQFLL